MNMSFRLALAYSATLLALPAASHADVIFSNFGTGYGYDTGNANLVGNAFDGNNYAEGETFVPTVSEDLSSLTLALSCLSSCANNFSVAVTTDGGDQPNSVVQSFAIAGSALGALGNSNAPLVLSSTTHPVLTAGTQYWVTVSSSLNDSIGWNLNLTGDSADQAISLDGGATWYSPSGQTPGAFEVDGLTPVPLPGGATLLISGVLLWGTQMLRRPQSDASSLLGTEPA